MLCSAQLYSTKTSCYKSKLQKVWSLLSVVLIFVCLYWLSTGVKYVRKRTRQVSWRKRCEVGATNNISYCVTCNRCSFATHREKTDSERIVLSRQRTVCRELDHILLKRPQWKEIRVEIVRLRNLFSLGGDYALTAVKQSLAVLPFYVRSDRFKAIESSSHF